MTAEDRRRQRPDGRSERAAVLGGSSSRRGNGDVGGGEDFENGGGRRGGAGAADPCPAATSRRRLPTQRNRNGPGLAAARRRARIWRVRNELRLGVALLGVMLYLFSQTATTKSARNHLRERVEDEMAERAPFRSRFEEGGGTERRDREESVDRRMGLNSYERGGVQKNGRDVRETSITNTIIGQLNSDTGAYGDYIKKGANQPLPPPATTYDASEGPIPLPVAFDSHLADLTDPLLSVRQVRDLPVFWHVPKSGGTTAKDYYGRCLDFVVATESGVREGGVPEAGSDGPVHPVSFKSDKGDWTVRYANVDTSTAAGLRSARGVGLVNSGVADAVATPLVHESMGLFDSDDDESDGDSTAAVRGRLFTVFRDPIDRALSTYHYLQHATWEPTYDEKLKDMTLLQYAQTPQADNNFITRRLSRRREPREDDFGDGRAYPGILTTDDLEVAKEVLRRKCLVGLMDRMEESVRRFDSYFGWTELAERNEESRKCAKEMLQSGSNRNKRKKKDGTEGARDGIDTNAQAEWMRILRKKNEWDIKLYDYAVELFESQAELVTPAALEERQQGRRRRGRRREMTKAEVTMQDPSKLSWF